MSKRVAPMTAAEKIAELVSKLTDCGETIDTVNALLEDVHRETAAKVRTFLVARLAGHGRPGGARVLRSRLAER